MVTCNLSFALQIFSIIAGVFGAIVSLVCMFKYFSVEQLIISLFGILLSLIVIACELYIFEFFKYFAFVLTFWGKGLLYLFMAFFLFAPSGIGLVAAIIFWIMLFSTFSSAAEFHHHYSRKMAHLNSMPPLKIIMKLVHHKKLLLTL